jgi:protein-disulfide isomerase
MLAGAFIGIGLYFGGSLQQGVQPVAQNSDKAAEKIDTTNKIDPVTTADHIKGDINAPVKIVEFSDFECPFCKRQHETLLGIVDKVGVDKVAWVYRQFPLEQLHPVKAMAAAMASECVAELGGNDKFWLFTDRYFEETLTNNKTDIETLIPKLVTETGVNKQAFNSCFEGEKHKAAIESDIADAVETGGRGTPWSIIVGPSGKTYPINGALPANVIEQMIEVAIKEA